MNQDIEKNRLEKTIYDTVLVQFIDNGSAVHALPVSDGHGTAEI